jgi:hypothetical protein
LVARWSLRRPGSRARGSHEDGGRLNHRRHRRIVGSGRVDPPVGRATTEARASLPGRAGTGQGAPRAPLQLRPLRKAPSASSAPACPGLTCFFERGNRCLRRLHRDRGGLRTSSSCIPGDARPRVVTMVPHDTAYLPSNHLSVLVTWLVLAGLWCGGPLLVALHLAERLRRERARARADTAARRSCAASSSRTRQGRSSASPSGRPARTRAPDRDRTSTSSQPSTRYTLRVSPGAFGPRSPVRGARTPRPPRGRRRGPAR